jgi:anti-sigma factor RsiW
MTCETARRMMEANHPGLAQHQLSCPACIVSAHAPYYDAPGGLERKVRDSLRQESAHAMPWRGLAIAACLLLGVSLLANLALLRSRVDAQQLLAVNVLSAHLRSLAGTHLLDVPSSDHHTVKPWFAGKLSFSPPVKDFDGFPLLGGRLEYLDGHPAAALVYGRRLHTINLFIWPAATPAAAAMQTLDGYHLQRWWSDGMAFWAVSDLDAAELSRFASLYRGQ